MNLAARVRSVIAPPPETSRIFSSDDEMRRDYRGWRGRQLATTFVGYAVYYFVRSNFSMAMPLLEQQGYSKKTLGFYLTAHQQVYGLSKFLSGVVADRTNPRFLMTLGLAASALVNLALGFASTAEALGVLLVLNGLFQGMGFPPVARVLAHWFGRRERGTMWGVWNTSHQFGAAGIAVMGGYLAARYGWQAVFTVPAIMALTTAGAIGAFLRDTPGSLGLPPVEVYLGETPGPDESPSPADSTSGAWRLVFGNPYVWLVCFANFFVYVIRYVFLNWAPTYLKQVKGIELDAAGWSVACFEIAGIAGSLLAGWLTDRFFSARRAPVCVTFMMCSGLAVLGLWVLPQGSSLAHVNALIGAAGFFIYGPQFLVGVMMADIASKDAVATAVGLSGFFGYTSGIISGWGMGWLVTTYGWDLGFRLLMLCAGLGALLFAACWNATGPRGPVPASSRA